MEHTFFSDVDFCFLNSTSSATSTLQCYSLLAAHLRNRELPTMPKLSGIVTQIAGVGEKSPIHCEFSSPSFISTDREGNVLISDEGNNRIMIYDPIAETLNVWKDNNGSEEAQKLNNPAAIHFSKNGTQMAMTNFYGNNGIRLWKNVNYNTLPATFSSTIVSENCDGPIGVAIDSHDNIYTCERRGLLKYTPVQKTGSSQEKTIEYTKTILVGDDGIIAKQHFSWLYIIVMHPKHENIFYLSDMHANIIFELDVDAKTFKQLVNSQTETTTKSLNRPAQIWYCRDKLFIADASNDRLCYYDFTTKTLEQLADGFSYCRGIAGDTKRGCIYATDKHGLYKIV